MNKASGGDGIPVELFQILKDDAVKVLHSICQHRNSPANAGDTGLILGPGRSQYLEAAKPGSHNY